MYLASIWFFIISLLWALWIATDGFDLGAGILYPFIGRNENEKAAIIKSIAPFWDGNEVWLVAAAGATFAAFPAVYGALFSFMYIPFSLLLFSLILRGVALEFIYKGDGPAWTMAWGIVFFIGSIAAPFMFGFIFGNVWQGLPFTETGFTGTAGSLINPFSILAGAFFVLLCILHGSIWLTMKTGGSLKIRAKRTASLSWAVSAAVLLALIAETPVFTSLHKNYLDKPALLTLPMVLLGSFAGMRICLAKEWLNQAFAFSMAAIIIMFMCICIGLYPNLLPSSVYPLVSLTATNSSSGIYTLAILSIVSLVLVPAVIACQAYVYSVFRADRKNEGD